MLYMFFFMEEMNTYRLIQLKKLQVLSFSLMHFEVVGGLKEIQLPLLEEEFPGDSDSWEWSALSLPPAVC